LRVFFFVQNEFMVHKIYTQYSQYLADLHTPVAVYNKLRDNFPGALLFESADYHNRTDNKSYICVQPIADFEAKKYIYSYQIGDNPRRSKVAEHGSEVALSLQKFLTSFETIESNFYLTTQGLWGFSSFESVQYFEDIELNTQADTIKDNPDLKYQLFKYVIIFDHFKKSLFIVEHSFEEKDDKSNIDKVYSIIQANSYSHFHFESVGEETTNMPDQRYLDMVTQGVEHCQLGDTFQVVLSREFRQKFKGDDFTLYRCLRNVSPSPYLFYLDYGDFKILGSSPESQLQVSQNIATINPIAGTVRRGDSLEEDIRRAEALKADPKEMSEHVMLVDLARNDLSKNSDRVEVATYAEIQYFSQVIHLVSKVLGHVHSDKSGIDIYADTFPAGTLSGAPKYRALQIIDYNENITRNFYGGAVGFFGFEGQVNHAIIIRSILSKNNTLVYQAGAGVVSESKPENELEEVNNKVRAIRMSIQKANKL